MYGGKELFLTENELEVMNVLWSKDVDFSRNEIIELSPHRSWKDNSIHTILNSLMKKQFVKVVGMRQSGKIYGRTYSAAKTKQEYLANQFVGTPHEPEKSVVGIFSALTKDMNASESTINELQEILDDMKKRIVK